MPVRQRIAFADPQVEGRYAQHVSKWKSCTACPLSKTRKKVVIFRGSIPCDILFVGEAPGESEDSTGYPFVGPAGDILDDLVREAWNEDCRPIGLTYGITNICCCLPLAPDPQELSRGTLRPPTKDEAMACAPRLQETLELANPKVVICLGNVAERFLKFAMDRSPSKFSVRHLLHPSAILRNEKPSGQTLQEKRWVLSLTDILKELQ